MGKPKGPSGCFYSSCTGDQLTELLRALALPVSGNKALQVARLRAHKASAPFADVARSGTISRVTLEWVGAREGATLESIKEACRSSGLKVTGNKYALVLSLLRAAGPGGAAPTDAAAKPRAPSTKPEAPERIRARLLAKCQADTGSWSNQRCKEHAERVFDAAATILTNEAHTKGLLAARNIAVADAAIAVLGALNDGFDRLCSPGYGNAIWNLRSLFEVVREISDAMSALLPEAMRTQLHLLCEALHREAAKYAIEEEVGDVATLFAAP
jgi:hypothetical protein